MAGICFTDDEDGSEDSVRKIEPKISFSELAAGTRNGLSSRGCCGSVFERLKSGLGTSADLSLGSPLSPQVSCRRRGFEEEPVTTRGETITPLSTAGDYLLVTITHGPVSHALACTTGKDQRRFARTQTIDLTFFLFAVGMNGREIVASWLRRRHGSFFR